MSDAWSDIQALKSKQSSLREKLAQRKKQRQEVVAEIIGKPPAIVVKSGRLVLGVDRLYCVTTIQQHFPSSCHCGICPVPNTGPFFSI